MQHPQASAALATKKGFARHVVAPTMAPGWVLMVLAAAAMLLVYNIFATIQVLTSQGLAASRFFAVFFTAHGATRASDVWWAIVVWAPVVLIPVCVALLVFKVGAHGGISDATFTAWCERGFLTPAYPLPIEFASGRTAARLAIVAAESLPDEAVARAATQIGEQYQAMDAARRAALTEHITDRAEIGQVFQDQGLLAMPHGMYFTALPSSDVASHPSLLYAVIPHHDETSGRIFATQGLATDAAPEHAHAEPVSSEPASPEPASPEPAELGSAELGSAEPEPAGWAEPGQAAARHPTAEPTPSEPAGEPSDAGPSPVELATTEQASWRPTAWGSVASEPMTPEPTSTAPDGVGMPARPVESTTPDAAPPPLTRRELRERETRGQS